jgi:hypothetical protein
MNSQRHYLESLWSQKKTPYSLPCRQTPLSHHSVGRGVATRRAKMGVVTRTARLGVATRRTAPESGVQTRKRKIHVVDTRKVLNGCTARQHGIKL